VVQFNGKGVKSLFGFSTDRRRTAYAITDLASGAGETPLYDALQYSIKDLTTKASDGRRSWFSRTGWTLKCAKKIAPSSRNTKLPTRKSARDQTGSELATYLSA